GRDTDRQRDVGDGRVHLSRVDVRLSRRRAFAARRTGFVERGNLARAQAEEHAGCRQAGNTDAANDVTVDGAAATAARRSSGTYHHGWRRLRLQYELYRLTLLL